jgi:hypothetical protein
MEGLAYNAQAFAGPCRHEGLLVCADTSETSARKQ